MRLSAIVAMGRNRVIGRGNALPWRLPADLRRFRRLTLGKPVIMGRRTFESIGKPLEQRSNIVISRQEGWAPPGLQRASNADMALELAGDAPEVMVIGGARIYELFLARTDRIYLTLVDGEFDGDVFFPAIDRSRWCEVESEAFPADLRNSYSHTFTVLDRVPSNACG